MILVSLFFFFPIYWQILTSLKYPGDITSYPPIWITSKLSIDNYRLLFGYTGALWGQKGYVGRTFLANITPYLRNSLIVGFFSTSIALIFGASLAYGIVRFKFGGKNLYTWLLSLRMIPPVVVAIPLFILFKFFRIINTSEALIVAYLLFNIPFITLLMVGFFSDIPPEIGEAALVDGCTNLGIFFRIMLPLVISGLVAAFIISFLTCWNELLVANALTISSRAQTFPVYTTMFSQVERGTSWGPAAAGGVIGMIPMLVFSFYIQKYLARGFTAGAIK